MRNIVIRNVEEVKKLKKKLKVKEFKDEEGEIKYNIRYNRVTYNVGDIVDIESTIKSCNLASIIGTNEICKSINRCKITAINIFYEYCNNIEVELYPYEEDEDKSSTEYIYLCENKSSTECIYLDDIVAINKNIDGLVAEVLDLHEDMYGKKFTPVEMCLHYSSEYLICGDEYYQLYYIGDRIAVTFLYMSGDEILYGSETGIINSIMLRNDFDITIEMSPDSTVKTAKQRKKFNVCVSNPGAVLIRSEIISHIEKLDDKED